MMIQRTLIQRERHCSHITLTLIKKKTRILIQSTIIPIQKKRHCCEVTLISISSMCHASAISRDDSRLTCHKLNYFLKLVLTTNVTKVCQQTDTSQKCVSRPIQHHTYETQNGGHYFRSARHHALHTPTNAQLHNKEHNTGHSSNTKPQTNSPIVTLLSRMSVTAAVSKVLLKYATSYGLTQLRSTTLCQVNAHAA